MARAQERTVGSILDEISHIRKLMGSAVDQNEVVKLDERMNCLMCSLVEESEEFVGADRSKVRVEVHYRDVAERKKHDGPYEYGEEFLPVIDGLLDLNRKLVGSKLQCFFGSGRGILLDSLAARLSKCDVSKVKVVDLSNNLLGDGDMPDIADFLIDLPRVRVVSLCGNHLYGIDDKRLVDSIQRILQHDPVDFVVVSGTPLAGVLSVDFLGLTGFNPLEITDVNEFQKLIWISLKTMITFHGWNFRSGRIRNAFDAHMKYHVGQIDELISFLEKVPAGSGDWLAKVLKLLNSELGCVDEVRVHFPLIRDLQKLQKRESLQAALLPALRKVREHLWNARDLALSAHYI